MGTVDMPAQALCRIAEKALGATGVAIVVRSDGQASLMASSGAEAVAAERAAYTLFESPSSAVGLVKGLRGTSIALGVAGVAKLDGASREDLDLLLGQVVPQEAARRALLRELLHDVGNQMCQLDLRLEIAKHQVATVPPQTMLEELSNLSRTVHSGIGDKLRERLGG